MLVSSNPIDDPEPASLELLILLPCDSLIDREIDAVSPFLNASNTRNFLTDCSIETPLSCGSGGTGTAFGDVICDADRIPAVPVDGLEECDRWEL